eukprot:COSAG02_NODE_1767_length_11002_cov_41.487205_4_plen_89_part_00
MAAGRPVADSGPVQKHKQIKRVVAWAAWTFWRRSGRSRRTVGIKRAVDNVVLRERGGVQRGGLVVREHATKHRSCGRAPSPVRERAAR